MIRPLPFLKAIPIALMITAVSVTAPLYAEVRIKHVPLSEYQAALTDGKALFDELCLACHGATGIGNGPAVSALREHPSDLTALTANNNGVFPRKDVKTAIGGQFRTDPHGSVGMPSWRRAFESANPEWRVYRRKIFAIQQVERLTDYLETIQSGQLNSEVASLN